MIQKLLHPLKGVFRYTLHVIFAPFPPVAARVLIYHSVDDIGSPISITRALFEEQMDYLVAKGYQTWTASKFIAEVAAGRRPPKNVVVLTFDDGYLNNITEALPVLEKRNLCATMFMVTQNDGDLPRWAERDAERISNMIDSVFTGSVKEKQKVKDQVMECLTERIATWDELKGAPERGFEILSHTRTHPYMDKVPEDQLMDELDGSRRDLKERGFGESNSLAWPYGSHNDRAIEAARKAGYIGTFLDQYKWGNRHHDDPMRIARVGVDASRGLFGLTFALGRGNDVLQWLKQFRPKRRDY